MQEKFNSALGRLLKKYGIKDKKIAVGVSGGADSLALALLLKNLSKVDVVALTVDHGLRKESTKEAQYVAKLMKKYGIEHHILEWVGEKPKSSMEEAARTARYDLMGKWCQENGVESLFIAHHKLDQAETFLMRLQRGSGVYGLAGMAQVFEREGVRIVRPLLDFEPAELKEFLQANKINWVEDPHNVNDDFLRVKVRKLLPELNKKIGLSVDRIVDTAKRMALTRDYLESVVFGFVADNVHSFENYACCFSRKVFLGQHEEIALRVLAYLLRFYGKNDYVPRFDNLENLYMAIRDERFKAKTLSGCEIVLFQGKLWIFPQIKNKEVLAKAEWEDFVKKHKSYKDIKMPYRLRLCLAKKLTML